MSRIFKIISPPIAAFTLFLAGLWSISPVAARSTTEREREPELAPAAQLEDIQITVDEIIASGFNLPVQVTHAGDGSGRLFVVEQSGRVRIIKNGSVLGTPFLDLSSQVSCCGERGLLSIAFHPQYESNGFFFVDYTRAGDGATVVARYQVSANADIANPSSAQILLTVPQPYSNHNGGQLMFGPDGYLYVATGDGGSAGDPQNNAQNIESLLGKILRIDVDNGLPYTIPTDNPFVGVSGRDEIWALGLRNPWRFSFDRLTGELFIGDVGQNQWEEIDYQPSDSPGGLNFGWRCYEGNHPYSSYASECQGKTLTYPIAEYSHAEGHSVTGGFVYRGASYPALQGRYFYADYVDGKIWSLYKTGSNPPSWSTPELELDTALNISSFGEDEQGELYVVDYSGKIRRLADVNGPSVNLQNTRKSVSTASADPLEVVTYTISIINQGGLVNRAVFLSDTVPAGLSYIPGSLQANLGTTDDSQAPQLSWEGNLSQSTQFTITYRASVGASTQGSVVNRARLSSPPDIELDLWAALAVPRPVLTTTLEDFHFPGTQPGDLDAALTPTADCDICHSEAIYDRWRGSLMSHAARDPLMWSALYVANADAPNAGEFCLRCHAPKGWLEERSQPSDGSALQQVDVHDGVSCSLCHRLVDPQPSTMDEAAAIDQAVRAALLDPVPLDFVGSSAMIVDPQDRRRGPFSFGLALPYHSAYQTDFLRQTGDAITRARMCGTCHNVHNPVLSWDETRQQFWPNAMGEAAPSFSSEALFPIETTFDEWLYSEFARGGVYLPQFAGAKADGIVKTCQDCHMPRATGYAADAAFNPILRDCQTAGCLPTHIFAGANDWVPRLLQDTRWRLNASQDKAYLDLTALYAESMLRKAATLTMTVTTSDTQKIATVRVTNHSGHKLPTGYPEGRQLWLNVQAFAANGDLVYASGHYDFATGELNRDADIKVYEVLQGISPELAQVLQFPSGASFHFVLNNTVIKDNRIPPVGYSISLYDRPGLRPVGAFYADGQNWDETIYTLPPETARILVILYYQTASKEYIDFLRQHGGVDGWFLGEMWETSKSPPQIVAVAFWPSFEVFLPLLAR